MEKRNLRNCRLWGNVLRIDIGGLAPVTKFASGNTLEWDLPHLLALWNKFSF